MNLKHFSPSEFNCQVTGNNNMEKDFLEKIAHISGVGAVDVEQPTIIEGEVIDES